METSNSNLLDEGMSNFSFKDLFKKDTIIAGLATGGLGAFYQAKKNDKKKAEALKNATAPTPTTSTPPPATSTPSPDGSGGLPQKSTSLGEGKILGMPKGLAIGLGIAVLAIGGFVTYKIIKAKA